MAVYPMVIGGLALALLLGGFSRTPHLLRRFVAVGETRWRTTQWHVVRMFAPSRLRHCWAKRFETGRFSAVDDPPMGYAFDSRIEAEFRIFGSRLSLTEQLAPLQNHCLSVARRFRFRTLGGGRIRAYPAGSRTYSAVQGGGSFEELAIDPEGDLIARAASGQMTLGGCESVVFSGDPALPTHLTDVVIEVVTFRPIA